MSDTFKARSRRAVLAGACAAGLLATAAAAHHSFSPFAMDETRTVTGRVTVFEWTNPHSWLWISVPNEEGGEDVYGFEGMSPNFLGRRGWSRDMMAEGDEVTVVYWPLKSGENGGMLQRLTLPDGTEKVNFGAVGGGGGE